MLDIQSPTDRFTSRRLDFASIDGSELCKPDLRMQRTARIVGNDQVVSRSNQRVESISDTPSGVSQDRIRWSTYAMLDSIPDP